MNLRQKVTLMNGKQANHETISVDLKKDGSNDHKIKCLCLKCKSAYTERPFICRCASNVFLRNIEDGKLVE